MAVSREREPLAKVLAHEGGYSNHPADPGGPTNKGVTQRVYDAYGRGKGQAVRSVKSLTTEELNDIYRNSHHARHRIWGCLGGYELIKHKGADELAPRSKRRIPMQSTKASTLACLLMTALTLAACTTSGVSGVAPLRSAIGNSLPGAQGKTIADQNRIDRTVAPGCAVKFCTRAECDLHTKASAARRAELKL